MISLTHCTNNRILCLLGLLSLLASCSQESNIHPAIDKGLENPESVTQIDLSGTHLTEVPLDLKEFKNLEILILNNNPLGEIPDFVWTSFPKLKILSLNECGITSLPTKVDLANLEYLFLEHNEIRDLPANFYDLEQLTWLSLSDNKITSLDDRIAQWENLTELDLSYNRLKIMPDSTATFSKINVLNIGHNRMNELPQFIGELSSLKRFIANNNHLSFIPEELSSLNELTVLNLDSNQIEVIPESFVKLKSLYWLFLNHNQIKTLPNGMASFSTTLLALDCNPIAPEEIKELKKLMKCNVLFRTNCE